MDLKRHCLDMAGYHVWASERLLTVLRKVSDADYRADCGLFFGSLHGTLNHLLLADLVWYGRFVGEPSAVRSLADEIEPDRDALAWRMLDQAARWASLIQQTDEARLGGPLGYRTLSGQQVASAWASTALHVFNHGTHHRGQMSAALTRLGLPAPEMDLIYFLRRTH